MDSCEATNEQRRTGYVILLIFALAQGVSTTNTIRRTHFPYQVSVESRGYFKGCGAILTSFWVLTLASAVGNDSSDELLVRAASTPRWRGVVLRVRDVILHPKYHTEGLAADLALLKLVTRLHFTTHIHPITLWPAYPRVWVEGRVSGWIHDQSVERIRSKSKVFTVPVEPLDQNLWPPESSKGLIYVHAVPHSLPNSYNAVRGSLLVIDKKLMGFSLDIVDESTLAVVVLSPHIAWIKRVVFIPANVS